jgi:glycosyltransferase involved in cell wall biosynthesis
MVQITVVTITYADTSGLKKTMESLPMDGFEWIVIDGTNDPKIVAENKDLIKKTNATLIQEPDHGRFDAMNKGLQLARGEVICFLNSGDTFSSDQIIEQVRASFLTTQWQWAVGETKAVDEFGDILWSWPMPKHNSLKLRLGINSYCHQATFVKTQILRQLGGFEIESLYSDWVLSLLLSKKFRPYKLPFISTHFLAGGISSVQTIDYWKSESCRLRKNKNVMIMKYEFLDIFLQKLASMFIASTRGKLIRPDLIGKYPK